LRARHPLELSLAAQISFELSEHPQHVEKQASFPNRVVRVICPIAVGGGIDAVTHFVASRLAEI